MSIAESQKEIIGAIFVGNKFEIPSYQRKYSWTYNEYKNLWNDLEEAVNNSMNHFFGTLIFREVKIKGLSASQSQCYQIIDGQQRITTLYILLSELILKLPDGEVKNSLLKTFIGNSSDLKLSPQGNDRDFLAKMIFDFDSIDEKSIRKRSQKLMIEAKKYFKNLLSE